MDTPSVWYCSSRPITLHCVQFARFWYPVICFILTFNIDSLRLQKSLFLISHVLVIAFISPNFPTESIWGKLTFVYKLFNSFYFLHWEESLPLLDSFIYHALPNIKFGLFLGSIIVVLLNTFNSERKHQVKFNFSFVYGVLSWYVHTVGHHHTAVHRLHLWVRVHTPPIFSRENILALRFAIFSNLWSKILWIFWHESPKLWTTHLILSEKTIALWGHSWSISVHLVIKLFWNLRGLAMILRLLWFDHTLHLHLETLLIQEVVNRLVLAIHWIIGTRLMTWKHLTVHFWKWCSCMGRE